MTVKPTTVQGRHGPDEQTLPDAKRQLDDAIAALVDQQPITLGRGQIGWMPGRYDQLCNAIGGETGARSGRTHSSMPIWCDAHDLITLIDTSTAQWSPDPSTVKFRYFELRARSWRPQDTGLVTDIAITTEQFAVRVDELLDPEPTVYLNDPNEPVPAACTSCGTRRVHKPDPANPGKTVMQPALKITAAGCVCQKCRASWEPGQLRMLAAALGYPLPAGVLE